MKMGKAGAWLFTSLIACALTPAFAEEAATTVWDYADKEKTDMGTRSGTYYDTQVNDGAYETLTEITDGDAITKLEHTWTFRLSIPAWRSTFHLHAHKNPNIEEDFVFAYSTDNGSNWTDMVTVTDVADANLEETFLLPDGLSDKVLVRVTDTNRELGVAGNLGEDSVFVDQMFIESVGPESGRITRVLTEPLQTASYQTPTMNVPLNINGFQPQQAGTFPVAIWFTGTNMSAWSGDDEIITRELAGRGFVAVSIDYSSRSPYPGSCERLEQTLMEVFDRTDQQSAVSQIAAYDKADFSKGLVVMGFSQGGNLAAKAKNFDSRIRAAHVIGHGYNDNWGRDCLKDVHTVLTSDRIRSVMGEQDTAWTDWSDDDNRTMLQETTGYDCGPEAMQCTQANGSGWWLVKAAETADGQDDHCFYYGNRICNGQPFDANWEFSELWWGMQESMDWLVSFADVKIKSGKVKSAKKSSKSTKEYCPAE